ncbi:MAG TPA: GNAT family N-acetyltransferase [Pseudolysinimonas sp.]|jgi:GNAT superfamily N-acetyltransferase|nr:GNAT family N-acetyltransferase [Pseudolysinimonas sp.]
MELRVVPVTDAPWADVRAVFGTRGDPSTCWCQYFKVDAATWKTGDVPAFERALCEQIDESRRTHGAGPGLLAYDGGTPIGWVAMEPRPAYARIVNAGGGDGDPTDDNVWVVSCFVVRVGHRRNGVAHALLDAAVGHARSHGARTLEAFPVVAGPGVSSADLYHGPLSVFEAAGFDVVSRPSERRAVVRLAL